MVYLNKVWIPQPTIYPRMLRKLINNELERIWKGAVAMTSDSLQFLNFPEITREYHNGGQDVLRFPQRCDCRYNSSRMWDCGMSGYRRLEGKLFLLSQLPRGPRRTRLLKMEVNMLFRNFPHPSANDSASHLGRPKSSTSWHPMPRCLKIEPLTSPAHTETFPLLQWLSTTDPSVLATRLGQT